MSDDIIYNIKLDGVDEMERTLDRIIERVEKLKNLGIHITIEYKNE